MKVAVLIDKAHVSRWQLAALRAVAARNHLTIFECRNAAPRGRSARHALYYMLNLVSIRNKLTKKGQLPADLPIERRVDFDVEIDGEWERVPADVLQEIVASGAEAVLKFGLGLLRVPPSDEFAVPILSYHHGDPRQFRGRPAGFYEILGGKSEMGQVVQILSNRLDAGRVLAFAETKVHPHSYRKTLIDAFRCSPLLLQVALDNLRHGRFLPIDPVGRNHRLPGNGTVLRFAIAMALEALERLAYGLFWEKRWRVARAPITPGADFLQGLESAGQEIETPPRYHFLADPFFEPQSGAVLAEAMRPDGRGEIIRLGAGGTEVIRIQGGHLSYPATIEQDGRAFMVPECCDWSATRVFALGSSSAADCDELDLPGRPRLIDPTPFEHENHTYLFGNKSDEGEGVLRLWVADSLFARFVEHPRSPIRISPHGARMAGSPFKHDGQLYRCGQDLRRKYGDGLVLFRVEKLSPTTYEEFKSSELRFRSHCGPHTLNIKNGESLYDYYDEHFTLFAGFRRLRRSRAA